MRPDGVAHVSGRSAWAVAVDLYSPYFVQYKSGGDQDWFRSGSITSDERGKEEEVTGRWVMGFVAVAAG